MREREPGQAFAAVSEYLRQEERREIKHEYFRGEQYAMSGGTARHSRIKINITTCLHIAARGTGCVVFDSDFKVHPTDDAVYYPDASVVCIAESGEAVLTRAPCLVVEVTSRSTARIDRGEKLEQYC
jgi:Uma2 family endonuclease